MLDSLLSYGSSLRSASVLLLGSMMRGGCKAFRGLEGRDEAGSYLLGSLRDVSA